MCVCVLPALSLKGCGDTVYDPNTPANPINNCCIHKFFPASVCMNRFTTVAVCLLHLM